MSQLNQFLKIGVPTLGVFSALYAWNLSQPSGRSKALPGDLKLVGVIAFNRHGDRTPTCLLRATKTEARLWKSRVPPATPLTTWSEVQRQLRVANLADDFDPGCGMKEGSEPKRTVNIRTHLPWWSGAITYDGLDQMRELGGWYRQRYVSELRFLGSTYKKSETKLSAHTTNFSRTMLSADALLAGLYPPSLNTKLEDLVKIDLKVNSTGPIWYPNSFHSETDVFTRNEDYYNKQHPNLFAENFREICKFYNSTIPEKAFLLMDPLLYRESTEIDKWPQHLDQVVQDFKDKFDRYYCFKVCRTREDLKSSVGTLLRFIQEYLENSEDKFTIVCGHDTTLIPVMLALTNDKFVKIPPYGSSLIFEVWKDTNTGKRYVKVLYNREEMKIYGEQRGIFELDELKGWWDDLLV